MNNNPFDYKIIESEDSKKISYQIMYKNEILAEIFHNADKLMLKIYPTPATDWWEVPLLGFQKMLELGKSYLLDRTDLEINE